MFDTITLSTVPSNPFALAGYTAGFWPTFLPIRHTYPSAHTISIAISVRYHADCLDVEPGDATPSEVVAWVRIEIRLGWSRPCVYSSWWEFRNEVNPRLAAAGLNFSVYRWDADYTFRPHIDLGFDATQWTNRALGRNLDESLVLRSFLALAHPPLGAPTKPKPSTHAREHRELVGHYQLRAELHSDIDRHHCRPGKPWYGHAKPRSYHSLCGVWLRHGGEEVRIIAAFHAKGVF